MGRIATGEFYQESPLTSTAANMATVRSKKINTLAKNFLMVILLLAILGSHPILPIEPGW